MPQRIQRKRTKGWRMPEGAVYVGRPTRFGNPWRIGSDGLVAGPGMYFSADPEMSQQMVIRLFHDWLTKGKAAPALMVGGGYPQLDSQRDWIRDALPVLRGHDVVCWCSLDEPCHADVLLELANKEA
ncbi:DUF4326 domain-containing protein [Rhodococcus sp. B10]|uniref:DUF4326 domain-containing protein n=1 Tax=Rhodococcus sp. B10 TaxID=2695876 RepID=UPI0014305F0C|nr:DUF4326 domain-containing protein [Rhodococcus sp. B10]NIL77657.1 hypothetical protein [Rhodococcus sp. B10]